MFVIKNHAAVAPSAPRNVICVACPLPQISVCIDYNFVFSSSLAFRRELVLNFTARFPTLPRAFVTASPARCCPVQDFRPIGSEIMLDMHAEQRGAFDLAVETPVLERITHVKSGPDKKAIAAKQSISRPAEQETA